MVNFVANHKPYPNPVYVLRKYVYVCDEHLISPHSIITESIIEITRIMEVINKPLIVK